MPASSHNLAQTFIVLTPALHAKTEPVSPDIYARLDANYYQFKAHQLGSMHTFERDWPSWEKHPAGDEIVVLVQGCCQLLLANYGSLKTAQVHALNKPGDYVVVPKDTWHTATIDESATLMFITPGEGTENRPA